jgi:mannose-6-phosphate isomerase-like protein (cupin superfamily)
MSADGPEHSANPPRAGRASAEALSGRRRVTIDQARTSPIPPGNLATIVLAHGSLIVEYYAPHGTDSQTAHTRDEVYIVIAGRGWFVNGPERHPFGPGDVLFVPAGVVHRFEEFTDDFAVWVVFYGPEGGERAAT